MALNPLPLLDTQPLLSRLRQEFDTSDDAYTHPQNVSVSYELQSKIRSSKQGKQRFWVSITTHHRKYMDDGYVLNKRTFGHFWNRIKRKGLRSDGIMCLETWTDILHGGITKWIDLQECTFGTEPLSVAIMRADVTLSQWKIYYREVLVGGKDADDVKLSFPGPSPELWRKTKKATKKRKRPSNEMNESNRIISSVAPPKKRRKLDESASIEHHKADDSAPIPQKTHQTPMMHCNPNGYPYMMPHNFTPLNHNGYIPNHIPNPYMMPNRPMDPYPLYKSYTMHNNGNSATVYEPYPNGYNNYIATSIQKPGATSNDTTQLSALAQYNAEHTKASGSKPKVVKSKAKSIKRKKRKAKDPLESLNESIEKLSNKKTSFASVPRRHRVVIGMSLIKIHKKEKENEFEMKGADIKTVLDGIWGVDECSSYQLGPSHTFGKVFKENGKKKRKVYNVIDEFADTIKAKLWDVDTGLKDAVSEAFVAFDADDEDDADDENES